MQKQSFLRGTLILATAALITRMLGFVSGIFLARMLGAEGMGLLMMAHPLVPLMITLTELGLPVAISKLVAEAEVRGDREKVKRILVISLTITGTLSIILTLGAMLGSKFFAGLFLTDQRAYYAMLAVTPIAPIVAVSAVLKGYFRGKQNMKSIAFSDVIENTVQIIGILALVQLLLPFGIEYAAAGAVACSVIGEGAGLLFLVARYRLLRDDRDIKLSVAEHLRRGRRTLGELLQIGLPTTGNGFIQSIYHAFQPLLITKSLAIAGMTTAMATKQFGMLAGYAFPLLFLPSFITHSLSTALIPAISEARAHNNAMLIQQRMDQAMRIALIVGAPSTVILYVWATPLTTMLYGAPEAGPMLKLLAPIFFLYYFEVPLHAVLLGLGKASAAMWNFILTTVFRAAAIFLLGSKFGITGVILGYNFGICFLTFLNFFSISSFIGFYLDFRRIVKVFICMAVMTVSGQLAFDYLESYSFHLIWSVLGSIGLALFAFVLSLLATNTINRKDVRRIPTLIGMALVRKGKAA